MFKTIEIKLGNENNRTFLNIPCDGITVFVGPNNSGKSLILKELDLSINNGNNYPFKLLSKYEFSWDDLGDVEENLNLILVPPPPNEKTPIDCKSIGGITPNGNFNRTNINCENLRKFWGSGINDNWIATQFLRFFFLRLDGKTRFDLTKEQQAGDLLYNPVGMLSKIFCDQEILLKIREIIFDAFSFYFVIDPTKTGHLRIRLSEALPPPIDIEQSFGPSAREFFAKAEIIQEFSDGVQAFVGIVYSACSGTFKLILIDEPEAFLFPPLAKKLGYQLAKLTSKHSGRLIASTHSSDFLMGCIQSGKPVNIVRLEYSKGVSKARLIEADLVRKLVTHPFMRSSNVISGLFYDGVVVTEADGDRVFYHEIYERLSIAQANNLSILFINAQSKQSVKDIVKPLRQLGVPAIGIVDIDILKDGGKEWTEWLKIAGIPSPMHHGLADLRGKLKTEFDNLGKDMKRGGGIFGLSDEGKVSAETLFKILNEYGIFVVPGGELESWLPGLGVTMGHGPSWVIQIMEKMGTDPNKSNYLMPNQEPIWLFDSQVLDWIKDPKRKGTD